MDTQNLYTKVEAKFADESKKIDMLDRDTSNVSEEKEARKIKFSPISLKAVNSAYKTNVRKTEELENELQELTGKAEGKLTEKERIKISKLKLKIHVMEVIRERVVLAAARQIKVSQSMYGNIVSFTRKGLFGFEHEIRTKLEEGLVRDVKILEEQTKEEDKPEENLDVNNSELDIEGIKNTIESSFAPNKEETKSEEEELDVESKEITYSDETVSQEIVEDTVGEEKTKYSSNKSVKVDTWEQKLVEESEFDLGSEFDEIFKDKHTYYYPAGDLVEQEKVKTSPIVVVPEKENVSEIEEKDLLEDEKTENYSNPLMEKLKKLREELGKVNEELKSVENERMNTERQMEEELNKMATEIEEKTALIEENRVKVESNKAILRELGIVEVAAPEVTTVGEKTTGNYLKI